MSSKTHKGLQKRLKVTARGKVLHRRCGKSHLMSGKPGRHVMRLRRWKSLSRGDRKALERQIGRTLAP